MTILRRIKKMVIGRNPNDNSADNLGSTEEIHNISDDDGSVESIYVDEKSNQHCGCFGPPGGRCSECGVISCVKCHRHCGGTESSTSLGCGKPLCREHSHYLQFGEGNNLPFCKRCYSKLRRKKNWRKVGRFLADPFIDMEGKNEG